MTVDDRPIKLLGIPMPISVNAAYANNSFGNGGSGRFKTEKYKEFEASFKYWHYKNLLIMNNAKAALSEIPLGYALELQYKFFFEKGHILTNAGKPKRNDSANRLKVLDDVLAKALVVDDCFFWNGTFEKCWFEHTPGCKEWVDVTIRVVKIL